MAIQTVGQIVGSHQPRTLQPHSATTYSELVQLLSVRQRHNVDAFMVKFPSVGKLLKFFVPANWGYCIAHTNDCIMNPCVTLLQVDAAYSAPGTAQNITAGMFVGLYSMTTAKEPYNQQAANLAAELFVAKYGNECTLYGIMLYFANYLTEYKSSFAQYDVQDILQQFPKKFVPWWRLRLSECSEQPKQISEAGQPKGKDALPVMLRNRLYNGESVESIKSGFLYSQGTITDTMISEALQAVKDGVF